MEKLKKLTREEMKKCTGGDDGSCTRSATCSGGTGLPCGDIGCICKDIGEGLGLCLAGTVGN